MSLSICEGSYCVASAVPQSQTKELRRGSMALLVKVLPISVPVVSGDTVKAGPARMNATTAWKIAAETTTYDVYSVKENCSLQYGIR